MPNLGNFIEEELTLINPTSNVKRFYVGLGALSVSRQVVKRLEDGSITNSRYDDATANIVDI